MKNMILGISLAILSVNTLPAAEPFQPSYAHRMRIASELLANNFIGYSYTGVFSNRTDMVPSIYRTMLALEALGASTNILSTNISAINGYFNNVVVTNNINATNNVYVGNTLWASRADIASAYVTNLITDGMVLYTNTFWDDSQFPSLAFKAGVSAPDFGNFTDANIQCYRFSATQDDIVYGSLQLSHRYKAGTTLKPHIHIAPMTAAAGATTNMVWWMYYSITNISSAFPASTLVKITNSLEAVPQYQHTILSLGDIANPAGKGSDVMMFTVIRKGTDVADTYDNYAALLSFDLHFEVDKPGSDGENP
jgi:hypothetical protein